MFRILMLSGATLGTLYLAWRLVGGLHLSRRDRALATLALLVPGALIALWPLRRKLGLDDGAALSTTLVYASYVSMGLYSLLVPATLLKDLVLLAHRISERVQLSRRRRREEALAEALDPVGLERRRFLARGLSASAAGVSGVLTGTAVYIARNGPELFEVDVPIANLPPALEGFRIAQLSDVHVGPTVHRPFVERIVAQTNALSPDLIALTGDFVDGSVARLASHTAPFADLRARHGAFFVTGNHEYYSGADAWVREFRRLGIRVLENESALVEHEGGRLLVAGVNDLRAGRDDESKRCDPARCLQGAPEADVRLLLAHQPITVMQAKGLGYDLQLSGHTHGGQFFPWNFFIHFVQPLVAGLYDVGDMKVYVNRGTAYWGPPLRLGPPPELTLLTLRRA